MEQDKRLLIQLTVEEFKELSKTIQLDKKYLLWPEIAPKESLPDIIYTEEAMNITGYKESTLYSKVSRREIPIISGGRPLTFSRSQLIEWMKRGRPTIAEMIAEDIENQKRGNHDF